MTTQNNIKEEQLQFDINRKEPNISGWLSGKIDKYEYLTGKETLPCNQTQIACTFSF